MVPVIFSHSLANLSVKVIQQTIYKDDFWFNAAFSHFCDIVLNTCTIFFGLFSFCRHLNHLCADVLKKLLLTFQMYVDFVDFVSCDDSRYSGTCGGVVAQINRMLVVKMG